MERRGHETSQSRGVKQGWNRPLVFGNAHRTTNSSTSGGGYPVHAADFPALPVRTPAPPPSLAHSENERNVADQTRDAAKLSESSGLDAKDFPGLGGKVSKNGASSFSGFKVNAPEFKPRASIVLDPAPQACPEKMVARAGKSQRFDLSSLLLIPKDLEPRSSASEPTSVDSVKPPPKDKRENLPTGRNLLDSSAPKILRGKEKVNPKPKKPSVTKQAVLENRKRQSQSNAPSENIDSAETDHEGDKKDASAPPDEGANNLTETGTKPALKDTKDPVLCKYCDHEITQEMISLAENVLDLLVFYQDRAHKQDPLMYKRRYVCGLRDVYRHLDTREVKLILVASNIEQGVGQHGPDQKLQQIIQKAEEMKVPIVFTMTKKKLGKKCRKPASVSMVGIYNYDVAIAAVRKLLELTETSREELRIKPNSPTTEEAGIIDAREEVPDSEKPSPTTKT
ncbi:hypothetical protein RvY_07601 [Ramazzottius varieornatus]|uniref:Ribosomal protein eL8/eL30/eS12/Gadd45 domain-containing protein n=1 Tax=Ramazzottius varieornatus TaxID=947166 RepID=A0A1D1V303_RAMVA|nr:hypothetical protein RvY_07601 [Ramazzottius varieornatus]